MRTQQNTSYVWTTSSFISQKTIRLEDRALPDVAELAAWVLQQLRRRRFPFRRLRVAAPGATVLAVDLAAAGLVQVRPAIPEIIDGRHDAVGAHGRLRLPRRLLHMVAAAPYGPSHVTR